MIKNIYIIIFTIFISIMYTSISTANPQQIVKNVICKEKTTFKNFKKENQ